jgi:perosamine synthetase
MDLILALAHKYNLKVVEDAAEAHGALYKGRRVGGLGDVGIFSFYGNKIITTGEGGCVVTNDPGVAERIKLLKNHGMDPQRRYWHPVVGYNYRLTNLQAALGLAQLERIEEFIRRKRQIARWYRECLAGYDGLTMNPEASWAKSVFWMNCVLVRKLRSWEERDLLMSNLGQYGIHLCQLKGGVKVSPATDLPRWATWGKIKGQQNCFNPKEVQDEYTADW